MGRFLKIVPLLNALKTLKGSPIRGLRIFYGVVGVFYIVIACKFFIIPLQKESLKQFHLKTQNFPQWALMQLVPSMYNYQNEYWWEGYHGWTNHFPLRVVTFSFYRPQIYTSMPGKLIKVQSTYQKQSLESSYYFKAAKDHLILDAQ